MDLKSMAVDLVKQQFGAEGAKEQQIDSALGSLLGGGSDGLDLGGLVEKFGGGGLAGAVGSWLGDGDNQSISADQLTGALGADKVAEFASTLGIDVGAAASGLSNLLPELVDNNSSGGGLLSGVAGLASKLFD